MHSDQPIARDGVPFPARLHSAREIAEYIDSTSPGFVDVVFVEENFRGSGASLRKVPIAEIEEGNPDGNVRSRSKERRYERMSPATMPPLVVDGGKVMDGNHRLRVARSKGLTHLWCYVVDEA